MLSIKAGKDPEGSMLTLCSTLLDPTQHSGPSGLKGQLAMSPEWTGAKWEDRLILLQDWIHDLQELYKLEREGSIG